MELPGSSRPRSSASTPASSPGLFVPSPPPGRINLIDGTPAPSPYLHPLQMHKVKETRKAQVEQDFLTGRKLINQYEIIDEIGRGVHGKVKLARNIETNEHVAIKIIQRFSKKRRLGKVTATPEDKTKREIAILKKVRHENIVGLLEVIDDPELKKIYMILEHVDLGEIVWRKPGTPQICLYERRRIEREMRGETDTGDEERFFRMMERRRFRKEAHRARVTDLQLTGAEYWSLEHGHDDEDDEMAAISRQSTRNSVSRFSQHHGSVSSIAFSDLDHARPSASRATSRAPSRAVSRATSRASSRARTPLPIEHDMPPFDSDNEEDRPARTRTASLASIPLSHTTHSSSFDHNLHNIPQYEQRSFRARSPSLADSVISHMSSIDDNVVAHDNYEEEYSYVPCLTFEEVRSSFRETVLGLEYLHYENIVHRDIKPANLLWTKDHHVKISDFGVSYFGKPMKGGDKDEVISEADATDFDDEIELAKTVGTPAFFAPELCFTDLDIEPPKPDKKIDIWSLGVTLYCLVYARIPFMAPDEYQLFKVIATQDVYIPKKRLVPVDPARSNPRASYSHEPSNSTRPYRADADLVLEDVPEDLRNLLHGMLTKDTKRRFSLRQVKWHPWVVADISNVVGWLDDTDPSRHTPGGRIQVDETELERAVVPLTFLERARSAVKKAVGKVIGRTDQSRKRATSTANSSGGDYSQNHSQHHTPLPTPGRESRRASLRGDETYFSTVLPMKDHREHPLSQSVTASPEVKDAYEFTSMLSKVPSLSEGNLRMKEEVRRQERPGPPDRGVSTTASIQTVIHRGHSHSKSMVSSSALKESPEMDEPDDRLAMFTDHHGNVFETRSLHISLSRESLHEDKKVLGRAKSVERALFTSKDKHGEPSVAVSSHNVSGNVEMPLRRGQSVRSTDDAPAAPLQPSPHFRRPSILAAQQSFSSPNIGDQLWGSAEILENRPSTATNISEGQTPQDRQWPQSTKESFAKAQEMLARRHRQEVVADIQRKQHIILVREQVRSQPSSSCPPSPDDDDLIRQAEADRIHGQSTITGSSFDHLTPLTSPSDVTSPLSYNTLGSSHDHSFASHPSLPTLVSGASSVSADAESDFLSRPGTAVHHSMMETKLSGSTSDTLTPPALSKQSTRDDDDVSAHGSTSMLQDDDEEGYNADGDRAVATEDDDSDSEDEGLTMGGRKRQSTPAPPRKPVQRRDTNISICSTETAKKVSIAE